VVGFGLTMSLWDVEMYLPSLDTRSLDEEGNEMISPSY
jgi:hypothetical protein